MSRSLTLDPTELVRDVVDARGQDESTERILDAASSLFAEHGIRRCTIDDIADRSGLGRTTVYRRVGGRRQVIDAVLARETRRFFEAVTRRAGAGSLAERVVVGLLHGLSSPEGIRLAELVRVEPELRDLFTIDAEPVIEAASRFLVVTFGPVPPAEVARVASVAELLVRLAISLVLSPRSVLAVDEPGAADRLHQLLDPLLAPLAELRTTDTAE